MTSQRAPWRLKTAVYVAFVAALPLAAAEPAAAIPPRSVRIAERVYARQAIAEARAVRAEARAAEIAKTTPEPPPPRPATLRRMARAGVPLGGQPQIAISGAAAPPAARTTIAPASPPAVVRKPTPSPAPAATASRPPVSNPSPGAWTLDPDPAGSTAVNDDGTRSVLATGGEVPPPASPPAETDRSGPVVTQPPIELLPTPPAE